MSRSGRTAGRLSRAGYLLDRFLWQVSLDKGALSRGAAGAKFVELNRRDCSESAGGQLRIPRA